jgi:hypothetical protein
MGVGGVMLTHLKTTHNSKEEHIVRLKYSQKNNKIKLPRKYLHDLYVCEFVFYKK